MSNGVPALLGTGEWLELVSWLSVPAVHLTPAEAASTYRVLLEANDDVKLTIQVSTKTFTMKSTSGGTIHCHISVTLMWTIQFHFTTNGNSSPHCYQWIIIDCNSSNATTVHTEITLFSGTIQIKIILIGTGNWNLNIE